MIPSKFDYVRPVSLDEAVHVLGNAGDDAKVIAGGQSLLPLLRLRLAYPELLVDIGGLGELAGVRDAGDALEIGAMTTMYSLIRDPLVREHVGLIAAAAATVADPAVRHRATIGGSLAHADAAAEYPAVALALDVVIETLSPRGGRAIPAGEFFTGIWSTALEPDELLTGVTFRSPGGRAGFAVEEFARRPGDFAVAGAAVAIELDAAAGGGADGRDARVRRCAIGLFGLGPTPLRASAAEAVVVGGAAGEMGTDAFARGIGQAAMADLDSVPSDLHGPASYRKRVGAAVVTAAWRRAINEAVGGAVGYLHSETIDEEAARG
jgi:aerobic carbon-monoxide dehydrogenase medium subunit